jgi:hypothetical protein
MIKNRALHNQARKMSGVNTPWRTDPQALKVSIVTMVKERKKTKHCGDGKRIHCVAFFIAPDRRNGCHKKTDEPGHGERGAERDKKRV